MDAVVGEVEIGQITTDGAAQAPEQINGGVGFFNSFIILQIC